MSYTMITSNISRICFVAALCLITAAGVQFVFNLLGYTILHFNYQPGRLVELAAALSVLAIAGLLRQIRDELRRKT